MRALLAAVVIAFCAPALAAVPITLVEPIDGAVLQGGSTATIRWTATGALPHGVEEWEAFLSVDGGAYYATRITPHLDIDVRSFEFRVPNVASQSVRLMLRVGDEREETSVDVPMRFSIVAAPDLRPSFASLASARGEAARPGDRGVAEWATGDRQGRELGYVRAPMDETIERIAWKRAHAKHARLPRRAGVAIQSSIELASAPVVTPAMRVASALLTRDILLLDSRRNI